jgi:hypothetical protein
MIPSDGNDTILINLPQALSKKWQGQPMIALTDALVLDIISTSAANGWNRPIYFANTVPSEYYLGFEPYMQNTGMAQKVNPVRTTEGEKALNLNAYDNITKLYKWGGLDAENGGDIYLDETIQRMVTSTRLSIITTAENLYYNGELDKAAELLQLMEAKLPTKNAGYGIQTGSQIARLYASIGNKTGRNDLIAHSKEVYKNEINYYASLMPWLANLTAGEFNTLSMSDKAVIYYPERFSLEAEVMPPVSLFINAIEEFVSVSGNEDEITELFTSLSEKYNYDFVKFYNAFASIEQAYVDYANQIKIGIASDRQNLLQQYQNGEKEYDAVMTEYERLLMRADNAGQQMQFQFLKYFLEQVAKF